MPSDYARNHDRERWWQIHDPNEYVCPDCGKTSDNDEFQRWEVHHINGEDHKVVGLCHVCHWVRHGADRKKHDLSAWKDEFVRIGGE